MSSAQPHRPASPPAVVENSRCSQWPLRPCLRSGPRLTASPSAMRASTRWRRRCFLRKERGRQHGQEPGARMAWRRCSGPRQKAQLVCRSSTARRLEHDLWRQTLCGVAAGPLALLVGAGYFLASILTRVEFSQSTQDSRITVNAN